MQFRLDCNLLLRSGFCFSIAMSALVISRGANADLVISHSGSANPTTEGWTQTQPGVNVTVGAINDGGTPAWFVDDSDGASTGALLLYTKNLTTTQVADAAAIGWTLSTTIRVPSTSRPGDFSSPAVAYQGSTTQWAMGFNVINGDTVVQLITGFSNISTGAQSTGGPTYTLSGISTYNTFDLRYDPSSLSADLFVNGVERISNYTGRSSVSATPNVLWGAGSFPDIGRGNFNAVSFNIAAIPEVSSFLLAAAAGLVTLSASRVKSLLNAWRRSAKSTGD
jgi:hypothetical protein